MIQMRPHPFDPLSPEEITNAQSLIQKQFSGSALNFRYITLREPAKSRMRIFLEEERANHHDISYPPREARVQMVVIDSSVGNQLFELVVDLNKDAIVTQSQLRGKHSFIDSAYMQAVEEACLSDVGVLKAIKKLELPSNARVCVEAWAYATDGTNNMAERITMCWFYMRLVDNPNANFYAYPLALCAEVSEGLEVIQVYCPPATKDEAAHSSISPFDRGQIQAQAATEYHPSLRPPPRTSTKPYQVIQPQGPSFTVTGNKLEWENWSMRVGFNYREGLTLHDIRYNDRSLFYRLSLAEMFVPYGDPRTPYPRKAAFDLGNDGAGINANNLKMGCDCLGTIKYFDAWHNTSSGLPLKLSNVVCCHEQDDGIMWKHTNHRTQDAVVTRSRLLILQTIITVSNYEYIFSFQFGQDASIHYEVRATGILSTAPIGIGEAVPYGTVVAPGVLAPYHQHLFNLRIDPCIDGHQNSLLVEESVPMSIDGENPFGVGYITKSTVVEYEMGLNLDFTKNRTFKIVNENKMNEITGTPVGFKLFPWYSQLLLAHVDSYHARRSEFGAHAIWITRYDEEEMFPAGKYTMQSTGGDGIASAILRKNGVSVRNEDIVIWHTFGVTHNPRVEDWPIMPQEKIVVGLKPSNFFNMNPTIDLKPSNQRDNQSSIFKD